MALRTFAPGVEIFPVAGETVLRTPSGEFLRVNRELGEDPDLMDRETLGAFEARGLVTDREPLRWPGPVAVVGEERSPPRWASCSAGWERMSCARTFSVWTAVRMACVLTACVRTRPAGRPSPPRPPTRSPCPPATRP
nr:hypothetical protein GCM10020093_079320 [Planobispora longispora]